MADESKSDPNASAPEAKKSKAPLLIIIVAVVLLLGGGGAAWFFLHHAKTAEAAPQPKSADFIAHLEPFTANLADSEDSHFLRVTMDLDLGRVPKGADSDKGNGDFPTARVRDAVIAVLTLGKADVLVTPDGKTALKHDIVAALQHKVPEIDARDVYFTEFLVQR
jgi:flagellar protein FliL